MRKVWLITGASRGLGEEIARAAIADGDRVIATGRDVDAVTAALGRSDAVMTLPLDVTSPNQPQAAVSAGLDRFGRIDVLVNNAGYGILGAFEELSREEIAAQFDTNVFGVIAVTQAVLPVMRKQRSGHILNISSSGGIRAAAGASAYCASKFALEGLSHSLAQEVADWGIKVTIVGPGPFRTGFFSSDSIKLADRVIDDYNRGLVGLVRRNSIASDGIQPGDPAKLARAIVDIANSADPPRRLAAGASAVRAVQEMLEDRRRELEATMAISMGMDFER